MYDMLLRSVLVWWPPCDLSEISLNTRAKTKSPPPAQNTLPVLTDLRVGA